MTQDEIKYHQNLPKITFEGRQLPQHAMLLSHANSIESVPDDTGEWFWRFTIAVGGRSDKADVVRHHAGVLLRALNQFGIQAIQNSTIGKDFYNAEIVFSDWLIGLNQVIEDSHGKDTCTWDVAAYSIPGSVSGDWNPPVCPNPQKNGN
jgi:hypothetical protein